MNPVRTSIQLGKIFMAFFGTVGSGKSVTAGICALGVTPVGDIGYIDGEGGRSGWAIDNIATLGAAHYNVPKQSILDRFKVIHFTPPYDPLRVVAAIESLEEAGCKTIIADCMSQCWDSEGGYLDAKNALLDRIAGDDERERKKKMASAAAQTKPQTHGMLCSRIESARCNLVLTFQAKAKFNAALSKPDDFVTPIQDPKMTRLALAVLHVENNGQCFVYDDSRRGTKYTHADILKSIPENGERFGFEHGERLGALLGLKSLMASPVTSAVQAKAPIDPTLATAKRKLFALLKALGGVPEIEAWLWSNRILDAGTGLSALTTEQLNDAHDKAKIVLTEGGAA